MVNRLRPVDFFGDLVFLGFFADGPFWVGGLFAAALFAAGFVAAALVVAGLAATGRLAGAFLATGFLAADFFAAGFPTAGFLAAGFEVEPPEAGAARFGEPLAGFGFAALFGFLASAELARVALTRVLVLFATAVSPLSYACSPASDWC